MATSFKVKGNEAFKAGNYAAAVGEYTSAMMIDPKDATFPLNRAAAYLKLQKFQDAERDCGKVLSLDPRNIKAFFRRGQARSGLGNYPAAKADIEQVLRLSPKDHLAHQELKRIEDLIERGRQTAQRKGKGENLPVAPHRRRVPIEIVEEETADPKISGSARQSGRSCSSDSKPLIEELPGSAAQPSRLAQIPVKTFQQAKEERTSRTNRTVGGGILRQDGSNADDVSRSKATTTRPDAPPVIKTNRQGKLSTTPITKPVNVFDFQRQWQANTDHEARWTILQTISSDSLPTFFKSSLEASLLISIFDTLREMAASDPSTKSAISQYLKQFKKVSRFETIILFLSPIEKQRVRELVTLAGEPVDWTV